MANIVLTQAELKKLIKRHGLTLTTDSTKLNPCGSVFDVNESYLGYWENRGEVVDVDLSYKSIKGLLFGKTLLA